MTDIMTLQLVLDGAPFRRLFLYKVVAFGLQLHVQYVGRRAYLIVEADGQDDARAVEHVFVSQPDDTLVDEAKEVANSRDVRLLLGHVAPGSALQRVIGISSYDCAFVVAVQIHYPAP